MMLDDRRLDEAADIHSDVATAVPQSDAMAENLPASLPGAPSRFQQAEVLDLLQNLEQLVGLY